MIPTYTAAQILAAEQVALATDGQPALMARAAWAVAREALALLPSPVPGRRAVLLVGTGNNGGDALFAGALLRRRGVGVTAVLLDPSRVHAGGLAALRRSGGRVVGAGAAASVIGSADLVVDGIVGLQAVPPLRPAAARLVELANAAAAVRVAVDLPSGLHPDGAPTDGPVFDADLTVTFGGVKTGLALGFSGELVVEDLGMAPGPEGDAWIVTDADVAAVRQPPGESDNKFSQGVVGIAAGSAQYPGAAVLCVGAAVNLRPGMVRYAGVQGPAVVAAWPEVVAAESVAGSGRVQAWVIGPGLGTDAVAEVAAVLDFDGPVLVDADALTVVAAHPELLEARRERPTVLTPHEGEFARLFPDLDLADRLAAVRAAAARTGVTVLLKGHRTLVASAGRTAINTSGSAWLASAGSGDVLSGVIGSLLAHGLDPFRAAAMGAHLHGRAGERAAAAGVAGAHHLWHHLS